MFKFLLLVSAFSVPFMNTPYGVASEESEVIKFNRPTDHKQIDDVLKNKGFSEKLIPLSFEEIFEEDSKIISCQIENFFPKDTDRLEKFKVAYDFGKNLFKVGKVPSREYLVTYLSYAALLSEKHDRDPESFINTKNLINYLDTKHDENDVDFHFRYKMFNNDVFFLPLLSETGLFSYSICNMCFANDIACVGIPYEKGDFDSSLDFGVHDVIHGTMIGKQGSENYGGFNYEKRHFIYKDMTERNLIEFEMPYYIVFHEHGANFISNKSHDINPIKNTINYYDYHYPSSNNEPVKSYWIKNILQQYKHSGGLDITDKFGKPLKWVHDENHNDLDEDKIDLSSFKDYYSKEEINEKSNVITFKFKNDSADFFCFPFGPAFFQLKEEAIHIISSMKNEFGIKIDMDLTPENFDMSKFKTYFIKNLTDFNDTYGYLFDKSNKEEV